MQSGSRGTEGEYPAFLLITSVRESYADEKSRILIGKCTHLEIRVCVSSPAKPALGLGLQFPRENIFACTHTELPRIMILGVRLKSSPRKLSSRSRGPSGAEMRDVLTGREGLSEAELTGGNWRLAPPCWKLFPLSLLFSIYFVKDENAKKISVKQTAIREVIIKDNVLKNNFNTVKNESPQRSRLLSYWKV